MPAIDRAIAISHLLGPSSARRFYVPASEMQSDVGNPCSFEVQISKHPDESIYKVKSTPIHEGNDQGGSLIFEVGINGKLLHVFDDVACPEPVELPSEVLDQSNQEEILDNLIAHLTVGLEQSWSGPTPEI